MKKIEFKGSVQVFSVSYNVIDTNGILDVHRYLIKKLNINNVRNY